MASRFGPPTGPRAATAFGSHRSAHTKASTQKRSGMVPDQAFGGPRTTHRPATSHNVFAAQDGNTHCMCCHGVHVADQTMTKENRSKPNLSGRKMATGSEWRYADLPPRADDGTVRSGMVSTESPAWMTRTGVSVPVRDYGSSHPHAAKSYTERIRDASVQKGCGKKCSWSRGAVSSDSPFEQPKSAFAQPYRGSGANGRKSPRAPMPPPYLRSGVQHDNDFGKSKPGKIGKQATSRFYNSIGGWSASRS